MKRSTIDFIGYARFMNGTCPLGDPKVGQRWRTEEGYIYDIVAIDGRWVFGRHPNSKYGSTQILRDWFSQPGWRKLR